MTLRERLADWISGGALTRAREHERFHFDQACSFAESAYGYFFDLEAIAEATRDGKSGTARKVHRMATEALK